MGQKVSVPDRLFICADAFEGTELSNMVKGNAPSASKAAPAACDICERRHKLAHRSPLLFLSSKAIKQASQRALDRLRRFRCRLSGRTDPAALKRPCYHELALRRREAYLLRLGIPRHCQARNPGCRGRRLRSCRPVTNSFKAACIAADRKASECLELSLVASESTRPRGDSTCSTTCSETLSRSRGDSTYSDTSSLDESTTACGSDAGEEVAPILEFLPCQTRPDSQARMKFLQKLAYEGVWVPKPQRPPRHQTVIIFDWDDTLLCTSFLQDLQMIQLPEPVLHCLKEIENVVTNLLSLALSLGHTFIITNAVKGWVEYSAAKHLPGILPVLERVRVVSARTRYEAFYPNEMAKWKAETFLEVQRQLDSQVVTNVVSLGDSHFEMDAALAMGRQFEQATIKTVKFQEAPSPEELVKQQELVCKEFERIVGNARNLRVRVEAPAHRAAPCRNE